MNALKKFEPTAYATLRIVFGFLFACHGASKVFTALDFGDYRTPSAGKVFCGIARPLTLAAELCT